MLFDRVHSPVAKLMCSQCHFPPGAPEGLKTRSAGVELCKGCHTPLINQMREKKRLHRPVAEGNCLSCHGPHAAKAPGLLKDSLLKTCGGCHADTLKRQETSFTKHDPVEQGACQRCHDPHAGDAPLMLVKSNPIEVCGGCHDWQRHSSHPIGPTKHDPRNRNLGLDCMSCHRAHGTEYKHMMPAPSTTELCTKCHEQYKR
jgi:predicted CXXCH cytochrome family protein